VEAHSTSRTLSGNAVVRATSASVPKARTRGDPSPSLRQHSLMWIGRSPEGPPADPGGNDVTAYHALLAHRTSFSSSSFPLSAKMLATDFGSPFPATKCGNASGCRSLSVRSTLGSWELARPVDTNNLVALDNAPSSTRALITPTWDACIIPSSSILARALVRAGCSTGTRCACDLASAHKVSNCPA
jgi:hypothetical protein